MGRLRKAVARPVAALTASVASDGVFPVLLALSQPLSIPSAIGLVALSAWSSRPRGGQGPAADADQEPA